jgi:hypothetical protein
VSVVVEGSHQAVDAVARITVDAPDAPIGKTLEYVVADSLAHTLGSLSVELE